MATTKAHLTARDVMTLEPVCVGLSTTIRALAQIFEENQISGAPVVDRNGKLVGVVSKSDLIRRCSEGSEEMPPSYLFEVLFQREGSDQPGDAIPEALVCVEDFMSKAPLTVEPEASAAVVARLMFEKRVHRVIVINHEDFPIGIITSMDMLGFFPTH
jgi:CBS domain-containing protein